MQEEWWERPVCYLCDYWWALLIALALLLTGWFTRGYWTPDLGSAPASTLTPTAALVHVTAMKTPPSEFYGYVNNQGGYAFNYPVQWEGKAGGTDAYFELPNHAKLEIVVRDARDDETLDTLAYNAGPLSIPKSNFAKLVIGGEPALQYDVLDERGEIITRAYQVLRARRVYYLTLFAPLETGDIPFSQSLAQLEQLVLDFRFLP